MSDLSMTPQQITEYLAVRQAEVDAQRVVAERLEQLADEERREQYRMESSLAHLKDLLAKRGDLP